MVAPYEWWSIGEYNMDSKNTIICFMGLKRCTKTNPNFQSHLADWDGVGFKGRGAVGKPQIHFVKSDKITVCFNSRFSEGTLNS